jgi:hypothetical protein
MKMKKKMKKNANVFVFGIFTVAFVIVSVFTACPNTNYPPNIPPSNPPVPFTSITDFQTWLSQQPNNTAANAYTVKLNVNSLGGSVTTVGSVGNILSAYDNVTTKTSARHVILDLSGSTITSIDNQAFQSCYGLSGVIIPSTVTSIEGSAFNRCYSLTSVTIPGGVISLGDWAFGNNDKLTRVIFQGTIPAADFSSMGSFLGDLRAKFYAANTSNGTPGTYTTTAPVSGSSVWAKL